MSESRVADRHHKKKKIIILFLLPILISKPWNGFPHTFLLETIALIMAYHSLNS